MIKRMYTVSVLVLLTIGLYLSPAFAGASIPKKGYGYTSNAITGTGIIVKNAPGLIYGITLNPSSTTSIVTVYDTNSLATGGQPIQASNTIWELEAASANSSVSVIFANAPLATSYGIEVSVANGGNAFLNYQ
jgi:hypothetical protein